MRQQSKLHSLLSGLLHASSSIAADIPSRGKDLLQTSAFHEPIAMHGGYRLPDWLTVVTQHQRIDDLGLDVGQWADCQL